jgi:glycosyltransferase involved in cell wall biosynthesis
MKVLHLSHFRDGSGWARAAIDQILALDAAGVEVVPRCLKFTAREPGELPARILQLEEGSERGCDVVIQNVLPPAMERLGGARHVAYYFAEADRLPLGWEERIRLTDESWVPNHGQVEIEKALGREARYIPCSTDVSRFQQSYKPHRIREEMPDRFFFYTIGEGHRKNLPALIRAFHLAFEPQEPVELVVKTSVSGQPPAQAKQIIEAVCDRVKHDMGLYPDARHYKREIVLTERLSEHEIMRLHATCDCFVSASYGEGWNIPAFDAMAMGKTPIYTDVSGHRAFLDRARGFPVGGRVEPIFGMNDGIYDARQLWMNVDVRELAATMRSVYEMKGRQAYAQNGIRHAYEFSHRKVGEMMRLCLEQGGRHGSPV